ncbi:hypothetical protein KNE206_33760 [Kitasatospora sp. NE20-6]
MIVTGSAPSAVEGPGGSLPLVATGSGGRAGAGATATVTALPIPVQTGRTAPRTVPAVLAADLADLGFDRVLHAADAGDVAALLAEAGPAERVAVVDAGFVGHRHALRLGLTDPRYPAGAVPGALAVAGAPALDALRAAARRLAGTADAATPLPDALAAALHQAGTPVQHPDLGTLVATVPGTGDELAAARAGVAAVDEEAVRLRRAVKGRDGFFTTFCVSPYSRYLARWCARRGLTPNQVTTASLVTALVAAASAATATRPGFVAAGVLLLLSFVLDCTDGQLARYSLRYSTVGAWLDATFDRAKEYAFYAGLAIAGARTGDHVWALALAAMVLMTFRHSVDFAFMAADQETARNPATAGTKAQAASSSPTAQLSNRLDRLGWTVWARRIIVLPIGERWALIALLTALTTPRTTLTVLLVGCGLACCYTTAGRVLRSVNRRRPRTAQAAREVAVLTDGGPLAELLAPVLRPVALRLPSLAVPLLAAVAAAGMPLAAYGLGGTWAAVGAAAGYVLLGSLVLARRLTGALDWLAPAFFRAGEYLTVLALALRLDTAALPAAFGLVAAVAYHHYDTVYRLRGGTGAPARWLVRATGGQEGRVLLVTLCAALVYGGAPTGPVGHEGPGAAALQGVLVALAAVLALVVVAESIHFWVFGDATAEHDESGDTA